MTTASSGPTGPLHEQRAGPYEKHGKTRSADSTRFAALIRYVKGIFHSRAGVLVITAFAVVSVAAATFGILQIAAPGTPSREAPSDVATPSIGSFSHHPVRIELPAHPDSYLGAYADGVPGSYSPIESFAATAAQPNIALYYSGWNEPFKATFATQAADHNAVPLIQIEPGRTSLAAIAAGNYDTYLKTFATAVAYFGAKTGHGVIIGFGHEPNGPWYPWGWRHVNPAIWVAAWRHVVDVFRQQGADNVTWLWTVNIIATRSGVPSPDPWWPGSSYVTWVGIDGYYYKPSWTFASLFGPTIRAVRARTLSPILISETGVAPVANQSAKIANLFAGIRSYGMLGFVWFDAKRKEDWRIRSLVAGVAFREGAKDYKRPRL
jgi:mannan endo-1,4-beta-mannosidase